MAISFENIVEYAIKQGKVPRQEKRVLESLLEEVKGSPKDFMKMMKFATEMACKSLPPDVRKRIEGLLEIFASIATVGERSMPSLASVYFSPGDDCPRAICALFQSVLKTVDICVFTITDDNLTREIEKAHRRGIKIRIVTDDEKSEDLGSDIKALRRVGIPVIMDDGPSHMHNKFAIFDKKVVVTGSYNWTRNASSQNQENIVISNDPRLVEPFVREFEKLFRTLRKKA